MPAGRRTRTQKIIRSNKLKMGFLFRIWFLDEFTELESSLISLLDQIPLQLDREVIKKKENMVRRMGGGAIIQGRRLI